MQRRPTGSRAMSVVVAASDAVAWVAALVFANLFRRGFAMDLIPWRGVAVVAAIAVTIQVGYGLVSGLYLGRWRFVSFEEAGVYGVGTVLIGSVLWTVSLVSGERNLVPLSTIPAAAAYQLLAAFGVRWVLRAWGEARRVSRHERAHRALVFGAGDAGIQVARVLREDPSSEYLPVGFLDDDPSKRRLQTLGLTVLGDRDAIRSAAADTGADTIVVAMPSASRADVQAVADAGRDAGLDVRVVPRMNALITGEVRAGDIREITLADLLGRGEVRTDIASITGYLSGRTVLITGAGGSIGSELCRVVARHSPGRLVMLDRDETALHTLQLMLEGRALLDSPDLVLCDIRDREAVDRVMREYRPDVVFHAAAHKHLTLLERYPDEAFKTNVAGTAILLESAVAAGVDRFVNVSTDKAAAPTSVLGVSKRLAEMLTAAVAGQSGLTYMSVRFGNVLGSRGSVIPTLRRQITDGGPLTVTDPEVTRYFMTVEEAVELVVQAGAIGRGGEVLVLDMGAPVRILDVAHRLVEMEGDGADVPIEFTGLRPGEKLHEVLVGPDEEETRRPHPLITAYDVPALPPAVVLDGSVDPTTVSDVMWKLAVVESPSS